MLKDLLKEEIIKLGEAAKDAGFEFSISAEHYPIVFTFKSIIKNTNQMSLLEEGDTEETSQKTIRLIFGATQITIQTDDKMKITEGTISKLKSCCKKVASLYYFLLHKSIHEDKESDFDCGAIMQDVIEEAQGLNE